MAISASVVAWLRFGGWHYGSAGAITALIVAELALILGIYAFVIARLDLVLGIYALVVAGLDLVLEVYTLIVGGLDFVLCIYTLVFAELDLILEVYTFVVAKLDLVLAGDHIVGALVVDGVIIGRLDFTTNEDGPDPGWIDCASLRNAGNEQCRDC
jgi:hypothetical protein